MKIDSLYGAREQFSCDSTKDSEELIRVITSLSISNDIKEKRILFRGVPDLNYRLVPSICRLFPRADHNQIIRIENQLTDEFRESFLFSLSSDQMARMQLNEHFINYHLDDNDEIIAKKKRNIWCWMQHYGAPTRLLDWSFSPWVSLYFACSTEVDKDGRIYFFNKNRLVKTRGGKENKEDFNPEGVNPIPDWISLIDYPSSDFRAFRQSGRFSATDDLLQDHGKLIASRLKSIDGFRYIDIPADMKPYIIEYLIGINITPLQLFPGLDGLGKYLAMKAPSLYSD